MAGKYFNGVKTMGLFVLMWVVLLGIGSFVGNGQYIWLFAAFGLFGTFYGYWNSDKARDPRDACPARHRGRAARDVPHRP
ncbi:hypothetical protein GCM10025876_23300 [Demequina litorisediminis]|uniref:Uncharacterized protein n=1 Tax=Demequina litorisediminis TaxID=1849022 RepID=A0ABQ6IFB9_9MICO|nr:hypothetical protein GCM10025876_23300 [Demequina litorisediminis]